MNVDIFSWLTPRRRAWLYSVSLAVIPLLIMYGVFDETSAPLWGALVAAVLGNTTALLHTPTGTPVSQVEPGGLEATARQPQPGQGVDGGSVN